LKKSGCSKIKAALRPLRFDGTDVVSKDSRQLRILNELFTMEGESDGGGRKCPKTRRMPAGDSLVVRILRDGKTAFDVRK